MLLNKLKLGTRKGLMLALVWRIIVIKLKLFQILRAGLFVVACSSCRSRFFTLFTVKSIYSYHHHQLGSLIVLFHSRIQRSKHHSREQSRPASGPLCIRLLMSCSPCRSSSSLAGWWFEVDARALEPKPPGQCHDPTEWNWNPEQNSQEDGTIKMMMRFDRAPPPPPLCSSNTQNKNKAKIEYAN